MVLQQSPGRLDVLLRPHKHKRNHALVKHTQVGDPEPNQKTIQKKKKFKNTKLKKQKTFQHGSLNIPGVIYTLKQNIKEQTNKSRSVLGQGHKCSAMNDKTRQEAMEPQRGGLGFGFGLGWGVVASGRRAPTVHSPLCCWRCRPRLPPACLPPPGEVFCRCLPRSGPVPHLTCPRSPE